MMKKAIGVVLFFSTLCAPALAGGQSGGGSSAPRSWSPAPSGHTFTMPAPVRIEPVRTPVVNNGPPQKFEATPARQQTYIPSKNPDAEFWQNYNRYFAETSCRKPLYDLTPYRYRDCNVNPYYAPMFRNDTNL
jgi:hypothetical protein